MKRIWMTLIWCALTSAASAQVVSSDSLAVSVDSSWLVLQADTLVQNIILPSNLEYIPAEESSELIADRLSCIEKSIPLPYNDKVHAFINYFTIRDREYTRMVLRRTNLYFPLFEKHLAANKLPDELKYLSIIESGLNPKAVSRARAVGLWQFMSGTGRFVGLHNDWYIDERMDPEKSTIAACQYLTMLYSMFHDWPLALAAYNSGPGTVQKAIRKSGYKKTFWDVYPYLPRETRAYFPQFVAMIYAVNYADYHNLIEPIRESLPQYDTITVNQFLHFETFAGLTGICLDDLQKLNPSVQRNAIPDGKHFTLRIPTVARERLVTQRKQILDSSSRVGKQEIELLARNATGTTYGREMIAYTVRNGDALGSIALRHHVRIDDLKKWNNLSSNLIHPGRVLNIWVIPVTKARPYVAPSITSTESGSVYTVQPGDTLWDIARKFQGLTIEKIKSLNNLKDNKVKPGQKLVIG